MGAFLYFAAGRRLREHCVRVQTRAAPAVAAIVAAAPMTPPHRHAIAALLCLELGCLATSRRGTLY